MSKPIKTVTIIEKGKNPKFYAEVRHNISKKAKEDEVFMTIFYTGRKKVLTMYSKLEPSSLAIHQVAGNTALSELSRVLSGGTPRAIYMQYNPDDRRAYFMNYCEPIKEIKFNYKGYTIKTFTFVDVESEDNNAVVYFYEEGRFESKFVMDKTFKDIQDEKGLSKAFDTYCKVRNVGFYLGIIVASFVVVMIITALLVLDQKLSNLLNWYNYLIFRGIGYVTLSMTLFTGLYKAIKDSTPKY